MERIERNGKLLVGGTKFCGSAIIIEQISQLVVCLAQCVGVFLGIFKGIGYRYKINAGFATIYKLRANAFVLI